MLKVACLVRMILLLEDFSRSNSKSNVGKAVTVSSGLSDLSSVLAEAEAEVDGRSPGPSKKN